MNKTTLSFAQRETVQANIGLKRYLESLAQARDFTPRSWLYEDQTPDAILERWKQQLRVLENGDAFERQVIQFDISQEAKWGPQGGHEPMGELYPTIVAPSFEPSPRPEAFSDPYWQQAKRIVTQLLCEHGCHGLRPASYQHVVDDMRARDTLESNSGWPLFTRRSKPEVVRSSIEDAQSGQWKTYPAIALFRRYNGKTRLVWMFPMSANIVEGSYFQVLQSQLIRSTLGEGFFAPWVGFEQVRGLVTAAYTEWSRENPFGGSFVAASDFTSTDAHFTEYHSNEVADVLAPCFAREYQDGLRESLHHMHNIPLVIGVDEQVMGAHGVSSGSNWTNFVETIFDLILAVYVSLKEKFSVAEFRRDYPRFENLGISLGFYAIGDDMAWILKTYDPRFAEKLENVGKSVGMIIRSDKTTNEQHWVKSLQRLFIRGYRRQDGLIRAVYPTIRALKSSVYPERFHRPKDWSSDMFCARQYMILENCVDHPLFEQFVRFVVGGNRHLPEFARKSAHDLAEITRETKLLPGLNPTYNQERRSSSLADFESIRIARKL